METIGVISKVTQPTPWCAGMVVVPKPSGTVRICVDLKPLNENVLREVYPIPAVSHTLALLTGAKKFSKIDANSGFWQVPLTPESRLLTTFLTPFGHFHFNKLPFGISSAPEIFQRRMSKILEGLPGVLCHMDDVLIFGTGQEEHDQRLAATLERLQNAGVTLNKTKCEFNKDQIQFLGHVINKDGVRADPEKTTAVCKMQTPRNTTEVRRFLGMVNQLGPFSPRLAELSQPLRELLSTKRAWSWGPAQDEAFAKLELSADTVLALYDPQAATKVSADASNYGLGAVLLQQDGTRWRPVTFASRTLTETEQRYAQIEKEALAATWACEKFSQYLLGLHFMIESDHKPLIPLLGTKRLDSLPPRVLRFRLRMARYHYSIIHVPGKFLYIADTLSRAPLHTLHCEPLQREVESFVQAISFPATEKCLERYYQAQLQDETCRKVRQYCQTSWPDKHKVDKNLLPYWHERASLSICNNLLLFGSRIVVPLSLRASTLENIHQGHQGVVRSRLRVQMSVWWPGVSKEVADLVEHCPECSKTRPPRREPLISTPTPDYPWQTVGSDLFTLHGEQYLLVADYFSRCPEVVKLTSTTASSIITHLRGIFARHGVPETLRADNGPQYAAESMEKFAQSYGFRLVTSSPHYPQSNGFIERMVRTVKGLLSQSSDPYLALLSYRTTPLPWCRKSPSELLMGRSLRSTLPQTKDHLIPEWSYLQPVRESEQRFRKKQKQVYDRRHRVANLPPLPDNTPVWVDGESSTVPCEVKKQASSPRSYIINTPSGTLRRNRFHLQVAPANCPGTDKTSPNDSVESHDPLRRVTEPPRTIMTRSKTGTLIQPPPRHRTILNND